MLGYNVELWHYAIFGWFASKFRALLPKLPSPYMERYLDWNLEHKRTLALQLCEYYLLVGKYRDAACYYDTLALSPNGAELTGEDRPFTLDERLAFLSAAMNAANLGNDRTLAEQTQALMQVAHVQQSVAQEFRTVHGNPLPHFWTPADKEALENCYVDLETKLCLPEWMYTECQRYAKSFGNYVRYVGGQQSPQFYAGCAVRFYQCSLQLLGICHPNEVMERIRDIYVPLLRLAQEADILKPTILQLAKAFYGHANPRFFPLTLIISCLEWDILCREPEFNEAVVLSGVEVLAEAGVRWDHIYKGYHRIYQCVISNTAQDEPLFPDFINKGQVHNLQMHMLIVLLELTRTWFRAVVCQPNEQQKREFSLHKLGLTNDLEQYKGRCSAMPPQAICQVPPDRLRADFDALQREITSTPLL
eukprot:TRINITY_DN6835_c0_g1_i1.p2 TRINITY_DN6835_c0_g1~~TRINITY_DN6835_c0_g1_i1.p2  ORF type:complete len:419 (-),score=167.12 TRINITY_DN6835_c0_g1_i1:164-1420(-)